ncbi:MAG: sulfite exporter TauE/SafE family protein [Bacteroidetes bacterium]|nr:MAG: sulfite exporter TauE/SafE family protein [Bacteroidota bacterium]
MMELLQSFGLTPVQWGLLILCAVFVGMAKTGVAGVYNVVVPILALIFGGRDSTGLLLPILILADIFAVTYYHRAAQWGYILRLLPWSVAGVILGTWVGDAVSDEVFKALMGGIILFGVAVMLWLEFRKEERVPDHWSFAGLMGLLGGFATMVGNSAGPILAVYLLAMNLPKNSFIGTGAWFFMIINLSKVPFHLFVWDTISPASLLLDLSMLPAIALGAFAGIWIVKKLSDRFYRRFVIVVTGLTALLLFI